MVGWSDGAWKARRDGSSQIGYFAGITDAKLLQGDEAPVSPISWLSCKAPRIAISSSACEVQGADTCAQELEYIRLVLAEVLTGQQPLREWQQTAKIIPAALVLDCRGVFDALAKSESSALGMRDGRSALEALGLKRAMEATQMALRWCHSEAMLGDCMTKNSLKAIGLMEFFLKRTTWKLVHDDQFVSARNRRKKGLQILDSNDQGAEIDCDWELIADQIDPMLLAEDDDGRQIFEDIGDPDIKQRIRTGL